jgi:hypothetical protein
VGPGHSPDIPSTNGTVNATAVSGNTLYIGGNFTMVRGLPRNHLAAIDIPTGSVLAWDPNANGAVHALAATGLTVFAGGAFTTVGGQPRNLLAAIDGSSGTVTPWAPGATLTGGPILALAVSNNIIYVGGDFTTQPLATPDRRMAAAYTISGAAIAWNPWPNGAVHALAVDGTSIYLGGAFTTVEPNHGGTVIAASRLVKMDIFIPNVTPMPSFNDVVRCIGVSNGSVYVGGDFTLADAQTRNRLAVVTTGSVGVWNPNANGSVRTLIADGAFFDVGGDFTTIGGQARNRIAQVDGTTGTVQPWNPNADGAVRCLGSASSPTTIFAGGDFATMGGGAHVGLAGIGYPTITISPNEQVIEGDGVGSLAFDVMLSPPSAGQAMVSWSTQDGTATAAGGDYGTASGTLVFDPGQTAKTIGVTIPGNDLPQTNRWLFVNLGNPVNATLGSIQSRGLIEDDDWGQRAHADLPVPNGGWVRWLRSAARSISLETSTASAPRRGAAFP